MLADYRRQGEVERKLLNNERCEKLRLFRDNEEAVNNANSLDENNAKLKVKKK